MRLDYHVDIKPKEEAEKEMKKTDAKTRTSMQSTVLNALGSKMPQNAGGQMAAPNPSSGWGATGM